MIVLHGNWIVEPQIFVIWGETNENLEKQNSSIESTNKSKSRSKKKVNPNAMDKDSVHPFSVYAIHLKGLLSNYLSENSNIITWKESTFSVTLPCCNNSPVKSPRIVFLQDLESSQEQISQTKKNLSETGKQGGFEARTWTVKGLAIPSDYLLDNLLLLDEFGQFHSEERKEICIGEDLKFWIELGKIGIECILQQDYLPKISAPTENRMPSAKWEIIKSSELTDKLARLMQSVPTIIPYQYQHSQTTAVSFEEILHQFLNYLIEEFIRSLNLKPLDSHLQPSAKKKMRDPEFENIVIDGLFSPESTLTFWDSACLKKLQSFNEWKENIFETDKDANEFRTCFKLNPPENGSFELKEIIQRSLNVKNSPKKKKLDLGPMWTLEFLLQAKADPSLFIPSKQIWKEKSSTFKFLKYKVKNPQEHLLQDLGRACRVFPALETALNFAHPSEYSFELNEIPIFLQETIPLLQAEGFNIILPTEMGLSKGKSPSKLNLILDVKALGSLINPSSQKSQTKISGHYLTLNSLLQYEWKVAIGDEVLTEQELQQIVELKLPLLQIRGQWVEVNPKEIEKVIQFFLNQKKKTERKGYSSLTLQEVLQFSAGKRESDTGLEIQNILADDKISEFLQKMKKFEKIESIKIPTTFQGQLRKYQHTGFSWMVFMRRYGMGICLADDMGLGKTIQLITLLLHEKTHQINSISEPNMEMGEEDLPLNPDTQKKSSKKLSQRKRTTKPVKHSPEDQMEIPKKTSSTSLLICPMTIIDNWVKEIQRFGPLLTVLVHHGNTRTAEKKRFVDQLPHYDIVITSYALIARDQELFEQIHWHNIVLDEAQNIKNTTTKQTLAIKALSATHRIALTGTPIENRLSELWSIMDFLNPGYLGTYTNFQENYARSIEKYHDSNQSEILKLLIQPFILRRLKTDKSIIPDLPDKIETNEYCHLTKEQATLYETVVQEMLQKISQTTGIERKGLVLSTMMKLKQICNHPAQFMHNNSQMENRSGKIKRLGEILQEILTMKEKVLIFTQFAEMGKILQEYLQKMLLTEVLFLYGETPKTQRDQMITRFQHPTTGPNIFILSLKAGGVGINLTTANNVIHFDRWWNPAVENQASDRAFRIGQTKNVQVKKFVCIGTIEEKINEMIEAKKELANMVVSTGEGWITELNTNQLRELFALDKRAIAEEI